MVGDEVARPGPAPEPTTVDARCPSSGRAAASDAAVVVPDGLRLLRGRVTAGRGDLAQWMSRYADAYARAAGARLAAGSLNVVLDEPWTMGDPEVRLDAAEVGVGMGLVACRLGDQACWILRTDKNDAGLGDHPLTVVEVVAAVHLRTALGLEDGDEVVLQLPR